MDIVKHSTMLAFYLFLVLLCFDCTARVNLEFKRHWFRRSLSSLWRQNWSQVSHRICFKFSRLKTLHFHVFSVNLWNEQIRCFFLIYFSQNKDHVFSASVADQTTGCPTELVNMKTCPHSTGLLMLVFLNLLYQSNMAYCVFWMGCLVLVTSTMLFLLHVLSGHGFFLSFVLHFSLLL